VKKRKCPSVCCARTYATNSNHCCLDSGATPCMHSNPKSWKDKTLGEYRDWLETLGDHASIEDLDNMGIDHLKDFVVAASVTVRLSRVCSLFVSMFTCFCESNMTLCGYFFLRYIDIYCSGGKGRLSFGCSREPKREAEAHQRRPTEKPVSYSLLVRL
jgi:hypothetical protein